MTKDYVVKVKTNNGKFKMIGIGFKQHDGVIRLQLDSLPIGNLIWIYPYDSDYKNNIDLNSISEVKQSMKQNQNNGGIKK